MNLLILDIDNTLVYSSSSNKLLKYPNVKYDLNLENEFFVYKRPHLDLFLDTISKIYKLALWTSGNNKYAFDIQKHIFSSRNIELHSVLTLDDCVYENSQIYKDISIIKSFDIENIICLDDNREVHSKHPKNLQRILPFFGNPNDRELLSTLRRLNERNKSE